jgi:predicted TIM-barrel fold metal-dependent hydrolase
VTSRVDAHQHFWDPARYSYPWMAGAAMDPVRRAFTPDDLRDPLGEEGIDGTVLVQTLSSRQETREFLRLAAATGFVRGVVGWADLTSPAAGWSASVTRSTTSRTRTGSRAPTCAAASPPCRPADSPTTC